MAASINSCHSGTASSTCTSDAGCYCAQVHVWWPPQPPDTVLSDSAASVKQEAAASRTAADTAGFSSQTLAVLRNLGEAKPQPAPEEVSDGVAPVSTIAHTYSFYVMITLIATMKAGRATCGNYFTIVSAFRSTPREILSLKPTSVECGILGRTWVRACKGLENTHALVHWVDQDSKPNKSLQTGMPCRVT